MAKQKKKDRKGTPTFVLQLPLKTTKADEKFIDDKFYCANRLYNSGVKHAKRQVGKLLFDKTFTDLLDTWKTLKDQASDEENDNPELSKVSREISRHLTGYGLTDYSLQRYINDNRNRSYQKSIPVDAAQKLGTELYQAVKKAVFGGREISFRKYGQTDCLEGKTNKSGFYYDGNGYLKITTAKPNHPRKIRVKLPSKKDSYAQEALTRRVKYCRVKRIPFSNGYRYYIQLVLEGYPPEKKNDKPRKGTVGIDPGMSTVAINSDGVTDFLELAPEAAGYNREIARAQKDYERKLRLANPNCYREDGRKIKGKKIHTRTDGSRKSLMRLKTAYRKKTGYTETSHGQQTNYIISLGDNFRNEHMNYRAYAKRSKKPPERQEQPSETKDSQGNPVHKYKRKKRYGKSVNDRSPGLFISTLKEKAKRHGCAYTENNVRKTKPSQYDHATGECVKHKLSDRTKIVDGHMVQRDCYSAFLNQHTVNDTIDRDACIQDFPAFLEQQEELIKKMIKSGDHTGNFGLKDFLRDRKKLPAV